MIRRVSHPHSSNALSPLGVRLSVKLLFLFFEVSQIIIIGNIKLGRNTRLRGTVSESI